MGDMMIEHATEMTIPTTASFDDWVNTGRQLATMKKRLGFMIGDWVNHGRQHFPEQIEMALEAAGIDQRFALKASNVAKAFPAHVRADDLSFDHHRAVLKLPQPERVEILSKASKEHWDTGAIKEAVTQWRYDHGELFDDEDVDTHLCSLIVRAWNRGTKEARSLFMDLAAIANLGVIDEDEAVE